MIFSLDNNQIPNVAEDTFTIPSNSNRIIESLRKLLDAVFNKYIILNDYITI